MEGQAETAAKVDEAEEAAPQLEASADGDVPGDPEPDEAG
jgi:hypothetical protein